MKRKIIKNLITIIVFFTLIICLGYIVWANDVPVLDLFESKELPSLNLISAIREAHYEHYGKYIRTDSEADGVRYISQEQLANITQSDLYDAATCSGGTEWWKCSNHADAWQKLLDYGVFTIEEYYEYAGKQDDFQEKYIKKDSSGKYYLDGMMTDVFTLQANSQCSISTLLSYLNNVSSNPVWVLEQFSSVFCLRHHQAVPSWYDSLDRNYYDDVTMNNYIISYTYNENTPDLSGDSVTANTDARLADYREETSGIKSDTTKSHVRYYVTNLNPQSLHNIDNGFNSHDTNVFNYALSFSEKLSGNYLTGNYGDERAQNAIWEEVGTGDTTLEGENLYKAGLAVDQFEKEADSKGTEPIISRKAGSPNTVTSGVNVGNGSYEPTGTIVKNINGEIYYLIGPFTMSDYALVASDYVVSYSGSSSGVSVDKNIVGGIIYGELELNDGTKIPIGYNEGSGKNYTRTDGADNAKIVYVDPLGNDTTSKGRTNIANSSYYTTNLPDYQYPYPKSTFYVQVAKDECGDGHTLKNINFEYRSTTTSGDGWVVSGKYIETKWDETNKQTGCEYYSATCSHGKTYSSSSPNETYDCEELEHKYYCGGCGHSAGCYGTKENPKTCNTCHNGPHQCYSSGDLTCKHGYVDCEYFEWKITSASVQLAQPFLAVHDANVYVDLKTVTNSLDVRLTTHVTIDKYITKVEHTNKSEEAVITDNYNTYDTSFDSEFSNTHRAKQSDDDKESNSVKLERGDKVTYNLVLENSSNIDVQVQIKDVLPDYCDIQKISVDNYYSYSGNNIVNFTKDAENYSDNGGKYLDKKFFITEWVEVAGGGTSIVTVELIATASDAKIENKNTATIVSSNKGRDVGTKVDINDNHTNYVRLVNGKGAVVNLAQIDDTTLYKVLESKEYYTVKSYNVVIDKFITKVEHVTTGEITYQRDKLSFEKDRGINGYTESQEFNDRDTYNDDTKSGSTPSGKINEKKYANSVYVEYGDKVTYNIDIQNTWYANAKENNQDDPNCSNAGVKSNPYYAPNYIHVDITDILPECYEEGSLRVKYYIYDVQHGNDINGESHEAEIIEYSPVVTPGTNGYKFELKNLYINPNAESMLEVSFIVDTNETGKKFENSVSLDASTTETSGKGGTGYGNNLTYEIRNINNYYVYNTTNNEGAPLRVWSADYFMLNDYNARIDKYISYYDEKVLKENVANKFEEYYETDLTNRPNKTDEFKNLNPVYAEKTERVKYTIKVFNEAIDEVIKTTGDLDYYKPATDVRVSSIQDTLDIGLKLVNAKSIKANIYDKDGVITIPDIPVTAKETTSGSNIYHFNIHNKKGDAYTVVEPGGYIEYIFEVEITSSNMELLNLENKAEINVLTDINNVSDADVESLVAPEATDHSRIVTERNIAEITTSSDFIRIKDLIISGKVWLDYNKDGYMDSYNNMNTLTHGQNSNVNEEKFMKDIVVHLYAIDENGNAVKVRTTKTDSKGLFTFARNENSNSTYRTGLDQRILKATKESDTKASAVNKYYTQSPNEYYKVNYDNTSEYVEYYVEYEYDGVLYKSTEVYSNKQNLDNYGAIIKEKVNGFNKYVIDSNAKELTTVREEFNKKYQTVTNNLTYAMTGANTTGKKGAPEKELKFVKEDHESYLTVDYFRTMTSRSFIYELDLQKIEDAVRTAKKCGGGDWKKCTGQYVLRTLEDGTQDIMVHKDAWKILIDAQLLKEYQDNETHAGRQTIQKQLDAILKNVRESVTENGTSETTNYLWLYYTGTHDNLPETEYLKYINLGLEEREDVDISLKKDVYEVKTTVNGEEMTYSYEQLRTTGQDTLNGDIEEASGYLQNYIVNKPYGLTLYESDFKYRFDQYKNAAVRGYKEDKSELNIEVTYKITVDNKKIEDDEPYMYDQDRELDVTLQEIMDVYDENFIEFNGDKGQHVVVKENKDDKLIDKNIYVAEAWYYPDNNPNKTPVELTLSNDSSYSKREANFETYGYNKLYISGMDNVKIGEGEKLDIYVKYVVKKVDEGADRDAKRTLQIVEEAIEKINGRGIENIAQVNAYSVWYEEDGKPASIVDCDSNAGNVGLDNDGNEISVDDIQYYEDSVYKTGIDITVPNTENPPVNPPESPDNVIRTISGKVWDDSRSEVAELEGYRQYFANGLYNDSVENNNILAKLNENVEKNYVNTATKNKETQDLLVRGAKAEFIEIVEIDGKYYEEKLIDMPWETVQNTRTKDDGTYLLKGFIPGYYIVRYTYGDDASSTDMLIFNGQDYKSTKYTGVNDTEEDEDKKLYEMQDPNKSDARDDEIRRLEAIAYSETMVNLKAEILKGLANGTVVEQTNNTNEQLKELVKNTSMFADTVTFYVKPEKLEELTVPGNTNTINYNGLSGRIIYEELFDLNYADTKNNARKYEIKNIDFGIEYRPETQISLHKEISRVKLITSDGKELVNLALETIDLGNGESQEHRIIEEDSTGLEYTQFISNDYKYLDVNRLTSEDYQGFIFVNIETDILQGCTINIEYKFTAENDSEVDLINKNLDGLRYRQNSEATSYKDYFGFIRTDSDGTIYKYDSTKGEYYKEATGEYVGMIDNAVYSAAATARNKLYSEYYSKDGNGDLYRTKELRTYNTESGKSDIEQVNDIYYGRFMSKQYYLGEVGQTDVISSIKFDKILDYVDTELVFNEYESEKPKDKLWATVTDDDLKTLYVRESSYTLHGLENKLRLVNPNNLTYVNYKNNEIVSSNLVISVDDRVSDNATDTINQGMSKFLKPYVETKEEASRGTILLEVSKVISSETETDDMQFENLAEVIQFTTQTGRRTNYATTIGNANASIGEFEEAKKEPDTSATEVVTLIPPTGLMRTQRVIADIMDTAKAGVEVMSIGGLVVGVVVGIGFLVILVIRKYKKRRIK